MKKWMAVFAAALVLAASMGCSPRMPGSVKNQNPPALTPAADDRMGE